MSFIYFTSESKKTMTKKAEQILTLTELGKRFNNMTLKSIDVHEYYEYKNSVYKYSYHYDPYIRLIYKGVNLYEGKKVVKSYSKFVGDYIHSYMLRDGTCWRVNIKTKEHTRCNEDF